MKHSNVLLCITATLTALSLTGVAKAEQARHGGKYTAYTLPYQGRSLASTRLKNHGLKKDPVFGWQRSGGGGGGR